MTPPTLPPIEKTLDLAASPERAFAAFTAEIHRWWPLASHSLAGPDHDHCAFEPRVGGRLFERDRLGREHEWGRVVAWDPPHHLRFTWRVGHAANSEQTVDVRFDPRPEGGTRLRLVHDGFTRPDAHPNYTGGWDHVLAGLAAVATDGTGTTP